MMPFFFSFFFEFFQLFFFSVSSNLYTLMAAWSCSNVFPFVSGTTMIMNNIARELIAAKRMKVPEFTYKTKNFLKKQVHIDIFFNVTRRECRCLYSPQELQDIRKLKLKEHNHAPNQFTNVAKLPACPLIFIGKICHINR